MRLYVGLTHRDWYRYLAQHQELEEVNFWRPRSQSEFHALSEGDPFLFELHYPERAICGMGWFEGFTKLPVHLAWKFFKEGNGGPHLRGVLAAPALPAPRGAGPGVRGAGLHHAALPHDVPPG